MLGGKARQRNRFQDHSFLLCLCPRLHFTLHNEQDFESTTVSSRLPAINFLLKLASCVQYKRS